MPENDDAIAPANKEILMAKYGTEDWLIPAYGRK
jgi:hypothetical protein